MNYDLSHILIVPLPLGHIMADCIVLIFFKENVYSNLLKTASTYNKTEKLQTRRFP